MKNPLIWLILLVGIIGAVLFVFSSPKEEPMTEIPEKTATLSASKYDAPPTMEIDPAKTYTASLATSVGAIEISLNAKETPKTVNNFVFLARQKFYDNTIFHRVMKGFMIQGGDPEGTGRGGPGYRFEDEPFTGTYTRGTVAMANAGPDTNGSQFFIVHEDSNLPPDYVIFGSVSKGIEVVDTIAAAETIQDGRENSRPKQPVTVTSIIISEQ